MVVSCLNLIVLTVSDSLNSLYSLNVLLSFNMDKALRSIVVISNKLNCFTVYDLIIFRISAHCVSNTTHSLVKIDELLFIKISLKT